MSPELHNPAKARPGDKIAVISPSFAAPALFPAIHQQALRRLASATGLIPVEYPTTRQLGATPQARAADVNAAFADSEIRAIISTIGGDDQARVIPYLDPAVVTADPKPFLGYSDNTNLLNWLWVHGVAGFYGGSTQVHVGPGPGIDDCHLQSLRAALLTGETLELVDPGMSEDFGVTWDSPRALSEYGVRSTTEPWEWAGPARNVEGPTWGGCLEIIDLIMVADRFPFSADALAGKILLIETSEMLMSADQVTMVLRGLGERGLLEPLAGVLAARPPVTNLEQDQVPSAERRMELRRRQRDAILAEVSYYNPEAVICVGVPFGHTRPQWIVPYGGRVRLDGVQRRVWADYS